MRPLLALAALALLTGIAPPAHASVSHTETRPYELPVASVASHVVYYSFADCYFLSNCVDFFPFDTSVHVEIHDTLGLPVAAHVVEWAVPILDPDYAFVYAEGDVCGSGDLAREPSQIPLDGYAWHVTVYPGDPVALATTQCIPGVATIGTITYEFHEA